MNYMYIKGVHISAHNRYGQLKIVLNTYISVYNRSLADKLIWDRLNQLQYLTKLKRFQEGAYLSSTKINISILWKNT